MSTPTVHIQLILQTFKIMLAFAVDNPRRILYSASVVMPLNLATERGDAVFSTRF